MPSLARIAWFIHCLERAEKDERPVVFLLGEPEGDRVVVEPGLSGRPSSMAPPRESPPGSRVAIITVLDLHAWLTAFRRAQAV
jgi:hypothetical protein